MASVITFGIISWSPNWLSNGEFWERPSKLLLDVACNILEVVLSICVIVCKWSSANCQPSCCADCQTQQGVWPVFIDNKTAHLINILINYLSFIYIVSDTAYNANCIVVYCNLSCFQFENVTFVCFISLNYITVRQNKITTLQLQLKTWRTFF